MYDIYIHSKKKIREVDISLVLGSVLQEMEKSWEAGKLIPGKLVLGGKFEQS